MDEIKKLFEELAKLNYVFSPLTPDRLVKARKEPGRFPALVRAFGLGTEVLQSDLIEEGLSTACVEALSASDVIVDGLSCVAISGSPDQYVLHDHWPAGSRGISVDQYVHCGAESFTLARILNRELEFFIGKSVLDLGCGSGVLSVELAGVAEKVLGIDISERAIEFASLTAEAYGFSNAKFQCSSVEELEKYAEKESFDVVVYNPPMVIPSRDASYPHRDGGELGIEIPLLFLEAAQNYLAPKGQVFCLSTNPIVHGKAPFLKTVLGSWDVIEKKVINTHFNQSVAAHENYAAQGIERVELLYLNLLKR